MLTKNRLATVLIICGLSSYTEASKEWISQEAVERVKASTTMWIPYEAHEHPFRHESSEQLRSRISPLFHKYGTFKPIMDAF